MYKITTIDGTLINYSDSVFYIKRHSNGAFLFCKEKDATGISFKGRAYHLVGRNDEEGYTDGEVIVYSIDSAEVIKDEDKINREAVEQALTEQWLDGIQTQQDLTDLMIEIIELKGE